MTELLNFTNAGITLTIELHPVDGFIVWAPPLAHALSIDHASNLLRGIPEAEKGAAWKDTAGGEQLVSYVTEAGFYRALGSRQTGRIADPETRAAVESFQSWVYREVLPALRTQGTYQMAPAEPAKALTNKELALMVIAESDRADAAEKAVEAARPAVEYVERFVSNDDVVTVGLWGNQFMLSQPEAFAKLVDAKMIYRKSLGRRWSATNNRLEDVWEYRPLRGPGWSWFDVRPQHNAPRHHNGQVRQTLYVRQAHALDLANRLGIYSIPAEATATA